MAKCQICHKHSPLISAQLGVCLDCIRSKPEKALHMSGQIHAKTRQRFDLPAEPPRARKGLQCGQCSNECRLAEGQKGFCGLVGNKEGKLIRYGGTAKKGVLQWYYDPLPTNCVSEWFCLGCTGAGYPEYTSQSTSEIDYYNLAVFYGSCSMDCLFCQNWHYRNLAQKRKPTVSAEQLASKVNEKTSCICFFGGDPSTQMPHAMKASQAALERSLDENRVLRICWETNGSMLSLYARQATELSLRSGGNVKFDIKAWDTSLNRVLCGTPNAASLENLKQLGEEFCRQRPNLPIIAVSTLLVPGYIDELEVENIAKYAADIDPQIPYTLLAFYPTYVLNDLPTTSRKTAYNCYSVAKGYLENVRIGNMHLLS